MVLEQLQAVCICDYELPYLTVFTLELRIHKYKK